MTFGKFRDGVNAQGQSMANWLDNGRADFLTRRRKGVLTRKSGDFINVYQDKDVGIDGFLSVGRIIDPANDFPHGFTWGGGDKAFADRGVSVAHSFNCVPPGYMDSMYSNGPMALYYGLGDAQMGFPVDAGTFTNYLGVSCAAWELSLLRTRDGVKFREDFYTVPGVTQALSAGDAADGGDFGALHFIPGGYYKVGEVDTFYAGMTATVPLTGGNVMQGFVCDDGGTGVELGATPYLAGRPGWFSTVSTLAPGVLLKMDRYKDGGGDSDGPALVFTYSKDAGHTWAPVTSNSMFAATMAALSTTTATFIMEMVRSTTFVTAPLSRTKSVIVAHVPDVASGGYGPDFGYVLMGIVDLSGGGCSISATGTLFTGIYAAERVIGIIPVTGGALIHLVDQPPGVPPEGAHGWTKPGLLQFTSDGISVSDRGTLPFPCYHTGHITAADKSTLICPMYDGVYSLYQSRDMGATWSRRTTISPTTQEQGGEDPESLLSDRYSTTDCRVVVPVNREGVAEPVWNPMVPWATDCRYPEPEPI